MKLTVRCVTSKVIGSGIDKDRELWFVETEAGEFVDSFRTRAEARKEAGLDKPDAEPC